MQVASAIDKFKGELEERRYKFNIGVVMGEVRKTLKWADGKQVKAEVDRQVGVACPSPTCMPPAAHMHTNAHSPLLSPLTHTLADPLHFCICG